ncbi:hypothetical protein MMC17_006509 [Xylographa soralifera]|nr:hypothetical protein [Xylographa soralifera]
MKMRASPPRTPSTIAPMFTVEPAVGSVLEIAVKNEVGLDESEEDDDEDEEKADADEIVEVFDAVDEVVDIVEEDPVEDAIASVEEKLVEDGWVAEVVIASTNIWTVVGALAQAR